MPKMLVCAKSIAKQSGSTLSKDAALADWYEIGILAGLRKVKWAQDKDAAADFQLVAKNIFGDAAAFCIIDIDIETVDRTRLVGPQCILVAPCAVRKMWITFRTQKNGDNGEKKLFTRNPDPLGHCFVCAMYRVLHCFKALVGAWNVSVPLAVYQDAQSKEVLLLTSRDIETSIRAIAAITYSLHPRTNRKELMHWSAHSLRVGACVLLHGSGVSATQIKWILHWRSDAFMVYLRNLSVLADAQHQGLDRAAAMPNFL